MKAINDLEPFGRVSTPSTWSTEVDTLTGGLAGLQRTLAVAAKELRQLHGAYERLLQLAADERPMACADGRAAADQLTAQERRVAALVGLGKTDREVSLLLQLSVHTVKSHVKNILRKRCLRSRWQLPGVVGSAVFDR